MWPRPTTTTGSSGTRGCRRGMRPPWAASIPCSAGVPRARPTTRSESRGRNACRRFTVYRFSSTATPSWRGPQHPAQARSPDSSSACCPTTPSTTSASEGTASIRRTRLLLAGGAWLDVGVHPAAAKRITGRLLDAATRATAERHVPLVLVVFYGPRELHPVGWREQFLADECRRLDRACVDTKATFL